MIFEEGIEEFLRERFDDNFEIIQEETSTGLAPDIRERAFQQVIYYWRKLKGIASRVTETEVRLNLPCQRTPQGREFGIEGVVDIVREDDHTIMYDIKTHEVEYAQAHKDDYAQQLNIYAHIWQILREQQLDQTAVITTALPGTLREAIVNEDDDRIESEMVEWEPVIDIPFDPSQVDVAIKEFGEVVDMIENGDFSPPLLSMLKTRTTDDRLTFAQRICRNCDARYSCRPYLAFAKSDSGGSDFALERYYSDELADWEKAERINRRLDTELSD